MNLDSCDAKVQFCQAFMAKEKNIATPLRILLGVLFEVLGFLIGEMKRKRGSTAPGGGS